MTRFETTWIIGYELILEDISGVYRYPKDCLDVSCKYFIEWSTLDGFTVNFVIIARNTSVVNLGLATSDQKVPIYYPHTILGILSLFGFICR